jgi:hypothetical protein
MPGRAESGQSMIRLLGGSETFGAWRATRREFGARTRCIALKQEEIEGRPRSELGCLWFTDNAVAAWRTEPQTSRGGQP